MKTKTIYRIVETNNRSFKEHFNRGTAFIINRVGKNGVILEMTHVIPETGEIIACNNWLTSRLVKVEETTFTITFFTENSVYIFLKEVL